VEVNLSQSKDEEEDQHSSKSSGRSSPVSAQHEEEKLQVNDESDHEEMEVRVPEPFSQVEIQREPSPEPVREPSPELVREPSPEPIREPSPEPVREPSPEPVKEPSPKVSREPSPQLARRDPSPELKKESSPEPKRKPQKKSDIEALMAKVDNELSKSRVSSVSTPKHDDPSTNDNKPQSKPLSIDGMEFVGSATEMRERLSRKKKQDPRKSNMNIRDKYEVFKNL